MVTFNQTVSPVQFLGQNDNKQNKWEVENPEWSWNGDSR